MINLCEFALALEIEVKVVAIVALQNASKKLKKIIITWRQILNTH